MPSVLDRLLSWTRRTFPFLSGRRTERDEDDTPECAADDLIYRLRHWPRIPSANKTADILRILSVMSSRPVNRRWILNNSSLQPREVDWLLKRLVDQKAVDVTDAGQYRLGPASTA